MPHRMIPLAPAALALAIATGPAAAAESYDNCTGFIDAVPAIITTQGTWCLRKDLATAITAGTAIQVATNNVNIDCNHFKLGNLAAGPATTATGIGGADRSNVAVRNCVVRGFQYGIAMLDDNLSLAGGGHLVEDNRVDGATMIGIVLAASPGSVVRDNVVRDIGGSTVSTAGQAYAIGGSEGVDIIDNLVDGVAATPSPEGDATSFGIVSANSQGATIAGNRVRGIVEAGVGGDVNGIRVIGANASVFGNTVHGETVGAYAGVQCPFGGGIQVRDNTVMGFALPISADCVDLGGNTPP